MAACDVRQISPNWIHQIGDIYHQHLREKADPSILEWPLVNRDLLNIGIIAFYVAFVTYIGPKLMAPRKPFDLRWLMVPYNIGLVIVNFYIFLEYVKVRWASGTTNSCETLDIDHNSTTFRMAEITWWFYITKFIELIDTVFFVLRKKERQLSRLHLVHHSSIPLIIWGLLRSQPGGVNTFFPQANAFVHCVMYTYYGISALGDDVTIHLKFKKYVTMTQMIQFILVLYHIMSRPFYGCNLSWISVVGNMFIAGFFFVLFCNFYWHEYYKKDKENCSNGMHKEKLR